MFFNKRIHGEKVLKCPRCRIDMDKIKKNNVIIDVCRKCNGMWLDDKEIEKLVKIAKPKSKSKKSKRGEKKNGKQNK